MNYKTIEMGLNKKVALVAHDNKKRDLIEWAKYNRDLLAHHKVYATGTTGAVLEKELKFPIKRLESGPLGGDQQIGARIAEAYPNRTKVGASPWTASKTTSSDPSFGALCWSCWPRSARFS